MRLRSCAMGAANRAGSDIPTPPLSTKSAGRHELHAAAPGSEDLLLLYHFLLEGIVTWLMEMVILKAPFDLLTSKRHDGLVKEKKSAYTYASKDAGYAAMTALSCW